MSYPYEVLTQKFHCTSCTNNPVSLEASLWAQVVVIYASSKVSCVEQVRTDCVFVITLSRSAFAVPEQNVWEKTWLGSGFEHQLPFLDECSTPKEACIGWLFLTKMCCRLFLDLSGWRVFQCMSVFSTPLQTQTTNQLAQYWRQS